MKGNNGIKQSSKIIAVKKYTIDFYKFNLL